MAYPKSGGLESPASKAFAITPHDTNNLATPTRAVHVGVAGNLSVILVGDTTEVTFVNVSGIFPIRAKRVRATGTTAGSLVGMT